VKNHLRNILEKLHLQNRVQAALYAVRMGLADRSSDPS
jgi:DNA-binding NarL/FixJ family response regulator